MVTIEHNDAGVRELVERVNSFPALIERFGEIAAHYEPICKIPYAVDIVRENQGRIAVGMSDSGWMLSYFPPSDDPPKYSLGDSAASGSVSFFFGDHTLVSRKYLVSREQALEVLREWFDKGTLSQAITWTEEIFFRL